MAKNRKRDGSGREVLKMLLLVVLAAVPRTPPTTNSATTVNNGFRKFSAEKCLSLTAFPRETLAGCAEFHWRRTCAARSGIGAPRQGKGHVRRQSRSLGFLGLACGSAWAWEEQKRPRPRSTAGMESRGRWSATPSKTSPSGDCSFCTSLCKEPTPSTRTFSPKTPTKSSLTSSRAPDGYGIQESRPVTSVCLRTWR